jgi:hypothetical protein
LCLTPLFGTLIICSWEPWGTLRGNPHYLLSRSLSPSYWESSLIALEKPETPLLGILIIFVLEKPETPSVGTLIICSWEPWGTLRGNPHYLLSRSLSPSYWESSLIALEKPETPLLGILIIFVLEKPETPSVGTLIICSWETLDHLIGNHHYLLLGSLRLPYWES